MINLLRLNHIIDYAGLKHTVLAVKLGMSRTTLWSRLNGMSEFTPKEIEDLTKILRLNEEEKRKLYDTSPKKIDLDKRRKS